MFLNNYKRASITGRNEYVERTSRKCSVTENGFDFISGMLRHGLNQISCETECNKYSWCRGVRFGSGISCRLLSTEQPEPIDGWWFYNSGNWVEPAQWKNGASVDYYSCYEKITIGAFSIQSTVT